MSFLVQDILDSSAIKQQKLSVNTSEFDIRDTMKNVMNILRYNA
jgi:hypothetical protein